MSLHMDTPGLQPPPWHEKKLATSGTTLNINTSQQQHHPENERPQDASSTPLHQQQHSAVLGPGIIPCGTHQPNLSSISPVSSTSTNHVFTTHNFHIGSDVHHVGSHESEKCGLGPIFHAASMSKNHPAAPEHFSASENVNIATRSDIHHVGSHESEKCGHGPIFHAADMSKNHPAAPEHFSASENVNIATGSDIRHVGSHESEKCGLGPIFHAANT